MPNNTFEIVIKAVQQGFDAARDQIKAALSDGMNEAGKAVAELDAKIDALEDQSKQLQATLSQFDSFRKIKEDTVALNTQWKESESRIKELSAQIRDSKAAASEASAKYEANKNDTVRLKEEWTAAKVQVKELAKEIRGSKEATDEQRAKFEAAKAESQRLKEAWQAAKDQSRGLAAEMRTSSATTSSLTKEFDSSVKSAGSLKDQYNKNQIALEQMRRTMSQSGVDVSNLAASHTQLSQKLSSTQAATVAAKDEFVRSEKPSVGFFSNLKGAANAFSEELNKNQGVTAGWSSYLKAALAGLGLKKVTEELFGAGQQVQNLGMAFGAIAGDAQKGTDELDFVREMSNKLKLEFYGTAESYKGVFAASQLNEMKGQKTRDLFIGIAEAGTAMRLSSDKVSASLLAVEQMMNKGTVQSQELKLQLGNALPGAFELAAQAAGMTTKEFSKQLETGNIIATEFLPKFAALLHDKYGPAARTAAEDTNYANGALNVWKTSWTDFKAKLSDSGFMTTATKVLKDLTAEFKDPEVIRNMAALTDIIATSIGWVVKMTVEWGKWIVMAAGIYEVTQYVNAARAALIAFQATGVGAFSAVISSSALWVTAIAAVGYAIYELITWHQRAAEAAAENAAAHRKAVDAIDSLSEKINLVKDDPVKYQESLKKFREEFPELSKELANAANKIDITTLAFQELQDAILKVRTEEFYNQIAALGKQVDELHKQAEWSVFWDKLGESVFIFGHTLVSAAEKTEILNKSLKDQNAIADKAAVLWAEYAIKMNIPKRAVLDLIDTLVSQNKITQEFGNILKDRVTVAIGQLQDAQKKATDAEIENNKKVKEALKERAEWEISTLSQVTEQRKSAQAQELSNMQLTEAKKLAVLGMSYQNGLLSEQEYEESRKEIIQNSAADRLNLEIKNTEAWIAKLKEGYDEAERTYKDDAEYRTKVQDDITKKLLAAELELTQIKIKQFQEVTKAAEEEGKKQVKAETDAEQEKWAAAQEAHDKKLTMIQEETQTAAVEAALALKNIDDQEKEGVLNHQEAVTKKTEAEVAFSRKKVELARQAVESAIELFGEESAEYIDALTQMEDAQKDLADKEDEAAKRRKEAEKAFIDVHQYYTQMFKEQNKSYQELLDTLEKIGEFAGSGVYNIVGHQYAVARDKLTEIRKEFEAIQEKAETLFGMKWDISELGLDDISKGMAEIATMFEDMHVRMTEIGDGITEVGADVDQWRGHVDDAAIALENFNGKSDAFQASMRDLFSDEPRNISGIKDAIKSVEGAYSDLISAGKAAVDALKSQWDSYASKIDEIEAKIKGLYADTAETIRDLQRALMTDEVAWLDKKKEVNEKYNQAILEMNRGNRDAALELLKEAKDMAKELAAEVKNTSGAVVMSLADNTAVAVDLINQVADAEKNVLTDQQNELIAGQKRVDDSIESTLAKMRAVNSESSKLHQLYLDWWEKYGKYQSPGNNAEPPAPKYAEGGLTIGPSHAAGGKKIEVEGEEYVQPKKVMRWYGRAGLELQEKIRQMAIPRNFMNLWLESISDRYGFNVSFSPGRVMENLKQLTEPRVPLFESGGQVPSSGLEMAMASGPLRIPGISLNGSPIDPAGVPTKVVRVDLSVNGGKAKPMYTSEEIADMLVRELSIAKNRAL